jgi:hypothetical protein
MRGLDPRIHPSSKGDGLPVSSGKTRFALLPGNDEVNRKGKTNG